MIIWENDSLEGIVKNLGRILSRYSDCMMLRDRVARCRSRSLQVWPQLTITPSAQPYLSGHLDLLYKRGLAQFRLANIYSKFVYINGARFKIFNREQCMFCMSRCIDLNHVLNVCPKYSEIKKKFSWAQTCAKSREDFG